MSKIFFLSLITLCLTAFLISCKNKNKSNQVDFNKENIQPFAEYPFDKSLLDSEIRSVIKNFEPYETTTKLERIIEEKGLTDSNHQLCYAYFIWMDLMMTDEYSEEALNILNKILEKDPKHAPTLKLKAHIENELKDLQAKANQSVKELYPIPIEKLTIEQAEEFANYLNEYQTDKSSYELQYKLWIRLYNEHPDTKYETIDGERQLYYGYKYYHLSTAAMLLWDNLDRKEEARPLFWKLIEWDNTKDVLLYGFIDGVIFRLIDESMEKDDRTAFIKLMKLLQTKYKTLNQSSLKLKTQIPVVPTAIRPKLIQYGLGVEDKEALQYIVQILLEQEVGILNKEAKENVKKAQILLNKAN